MFVSVFLIMLQSEGTTKIDSGGEESSPPPKSRAHFFHDNSKTIYSQRHIISKDYTNLGNSHHGTLSSFYAVRHFSYNIYKHFSFSKDSKGQSASFPVNG